MDDGDHIRTGTGGFGDYLESGTFESCDAHHGQRCLLVRLHAVPGDVRHDFGSYAADCAVVDAEFSVEYGDHTYWVPGEVVHVVSALNWGESFEDSVESDGDIGACGEALL